MPSAADKKRRQKRRSEGRQVDADDRAHGHVHGNSRLAARTAAHGGSAISRDTKVPTKVEIAYAQVRAARRMKMEPDSRHLETIRVHEAQAAAKGEATKAEQAARAVSKREASRRRAAARKAEAAAAADEQASVEERVAKMRAERNARIAAAQGKRARRSGQ